MNVFFEEDGNFKIASIMTETQGSMQIESVSGKRSKIIVGVTNHNGITYGVGYKKHPRYHLIAQ